MRTILLVALLLVSCSPGGDAAAPATAEPAAETPTQASEAPPEARRYATLPQIARAIGCTKLEDVGTGGNRGLRAFGVCYLGSDNIDVYLVSGHSWDHLADQFTTVTGPGWIVVCPTGLDVAIEVQAAIGGTVTDV